MFQKSYGRGTDWALVAFVTVAVLIVGTLVLSPIACITATRHSAEYRTFTVRDKERVGGDNGKYLVFTDRGVFSVEDSVSFGTWNASDRYNGIEVGKTYTCRVAGWRVHFTSSYENIIGPCDPSVTQ